LAGCTYSYVAGDSDFWLVKTDASGNMEWNRTYGGALDDNAYSVVQTSDGGYALAGSTESSGAGRDFWVVKTDSTGSMARSQVYGGINDELAHSVVQTSDGGYALAGWTSSYGAGSADFWLIKVWGPIRIVARERISNYLESADLDDDGNPDYAWTSRYDISYISFVGQTLRIKINIQLRNDSKYPVPALELAALKVQWKDGIEGIWSNRYDITDVGGLYTYRIEVTINWVNANPDYVVNVNATKGRSNMLEWYTQTRWGPQYQDEIAAHEVGHMLGLYDEYLPDGALDPSTRFTTTNSLMADLGPTRIWHYEQILEWLETRSGRDLSLAQSPLPPYQLDDPIPDFSDPQPPYAPPVGGTTIPIDNILVDNTSLAPYISLASTILVATAATAIYVKHVKHRKKKQ
jgi:hypothetical protein